jgi:predicted ArsR family transcriptional regulator
MSTRVHRALSSPVRSRILAELRAGDPQDVQQLADRLGLHFNTVRAHLAVLDDAGLVTSQPQGRNGPGRPRRLYRATTEAAQERDEQGYRFLARVLASHLAATADDPPAVAKHAGAAWGRYLVKRPAPFETVEPTTAIDHVVAVLANFGFAPQLDDNDPAAPRVLLRRCPFLDVARDHQDVVCSIHLGLMRGALAELGGKVEARDLLPFVQPNLCVSHLATPA